MTPMKTTLLAITTIAFAATIDTVDAYGQQAPRDWSFGFSGVTYLFEPEDAVFTDADEHLEGNFGFRFTKASFNGRRLGWMLDTELYLGVASRELLDVDMPNTIFGLQAFVGPVLALGPLQTYATVGVNRTTVGESEIVEVPGLVVIQYVGTGGLSNTWAGLLNALGQSAGSADVIASIPKYSKVSAAGAFGMSYDFGAGDLGMRISLEYMPVFIGPTRNNFRTTLSIAG